MSCVATCYVVADCHLRYEINELLLLLLLLLNKSAQSNLGTGRVAASCSQHQQCAVAFIHEYACYSGNLAA